MASFLEDVNRTPVSAELLGEVIEMHASMPITDRPPFEVRAIRLFELLDRKGLRRHRAALATAIDFRLTALAQLQRDGALRAWFLPGTEPGMEYVHADLVKAAAEEPLIEDDHGRTVFDPESFCRRVLATQRHEEVGESEFVMSVPRRRSIFLTITYLSMD